jgi:apolipoprotein N-acyltransferase
LSLLLELLLAALLGAAHSLVFVHTGWWWAQFAIVAVFAWRTAVLVPRRAAAVGFVFGTLWIACGTWWLFISMHTYGGLPAWLAVLAIAALSAILSLYLAAAMAAYSHWRSGCGWRDALLFGAVWLLAELARGVIFTGFPWLASGYAQVDSPLAAFAPWAGVYGLGFVIAVLGAWPATNHLAARRHRAAPPIGLALVLGLAAWLGPGQFSAPAGTLSVTLLQGNVPQDEKFAAEQMPKALAWTHDQLLAARGDLVVAPETVIPLLPSQLDPGYWEEIASHFQRGPQAALLGLPLGDDETGYTNSAAGISSATKALPGGFYRYDKHHLVPFGEFIPNGFHWFTQLMNIPLGDFNRGPVGAPSFDFRGEHIGANICYEDLFGEELRQYQQHRLVRRHRRDPAAPADLAHALARIPATDAARHQHRRNRRDRSHRPRHRGARALHPGRARRERAGPHRHDAVRVVGAALRPVAAVRAGRGDRGDPGRVRPRQPARATLNGYAPRL